MPTTVNPIIKAAELEALVNAKSVTVIDATYTPRTDFPNWERFKKEYYGDFEKLIKEFPESAYVEEHIDGAVNFSLDIGMYISQYKRYDLYPAELFEKYARLLGIDCNSHVIIYGRGNGAGMLFAAHVYWLLKYYGLKKVQVLDGGIEAWKRQGFPVTNKAVVPKLGDFKAHLDPALLVSFEQMKELLQDKGKPTEKNILDCRPRDQYLTEARKLYDVDVKGCHLKHAKPLPALELVDSNGVIARECADKLLKDIGFVQNKPTITYCALGNQGSLTFLILQSFGISDVSLYHGGMTEFLHRCSENLE